MRILGIETSCDETAAAVVEDGHRLLSSVIASSVGLHVAYGGVVPEIAARSHLESILPVIEQALKTAKTDWNDIDVIAVTYGPGLIGSLLIGVMTARTLAIAKQKPLYNINHVRAHPYACFITDTTLPGYQLISNAPALPALVMVVSGNHTLLALLKKHGLYHLLGQTRDDAIGEAFDKVAKMMGLPYPGGPSVSKAAKDGSPDFMRLPSASLPGGYDFSFSGLKTAVLRASQAMAGKDYTLPSTELPALLNAAQKANIAASFQKTAVESLIKPLKRATEEYRPRSIIVAGGVAADNLLRTRLTETFTSLPVFIPDRKLCTDNAAMIAACAYFNQSVNNPADPYKLTVEPNLPF